MSYGTLAYTGTNPIGGGAGYISPHGYSQATADYIVRTAAELIAALKLATSGEVIWLAADITCPSVDALGTLRSKAVLASDWTHTITQTHTTQTFMQPVIWAESNAVFSGLRGKGPGGMVGMNGPGNCAIRGVSGARRIEVENCEIGQFPCGGIYFYGGGMVWNDDGPNGRHWVHHSYIHHIQKHGFGYGISQEGPCSYLAEACRFDACRHEVMAQAESTGLEVRYCEFGDGVYSATYASHQVDSHGGEGKAYPSACKHISVHHNDFSENVTNEVKPNVCIRGIPTYGAEIFANRTRKKHNGQAGVFSETMPNGAFTVWGGATGTLASYNVSVHDNEYGWDGAEAPEEPPDEPPVDTNAPDIKVTALEAPEVAVGGTYAVTATVENKGDGPGSADIVIGYITKAGVRRPLLTQSVELEAGQSITVTQTGAAATVGDWTFYCGTLTTVLKIVQPAPKFEADSSVSIGVNVSNVGNAPGTATVILGGQSYTVTLAAGESQRVEFTLSVEVQ